MTAAKRKARAVGTAPSQGTKHMEKITRMVKSVKGCFFLC